MCIYVYVYVYIDAYTVHIDVYINICIHIYTCIWDGNDKIILLIDYDGYKLGKYIYNINVYKYMCVYI
jgi:hypothetical protein